METCTSGAIRGSPGGLGASPRPGGRLDVSGRAALCLQRAHTHGLPPTPAVLVRYQAVLVMNGASVCVPKLCARGLHCISRNPWLCCTCCSSC